MGKRNATPDALPQNAVALVRLSDLRFEDLDDVGQAKGNVDQTQRIMVHGKRIGWKIGRVIVENDLVRRADGSIKGVSAFKRRKILLPNGRSEWRTFRPGLRQAMDLLASGEHDGFIGLDLDRVLRDPRDLEDMIDIAEEYGVPVESVTGSLRLNNDANITMARVMVAVANKESRDKSRRVSAARERQARNGEYGGGRRPYGFDKDGVTIRPEEAKEILDWSIRVVQADEAEEDSERSGSLRAIALDLRERNVPTVTGSEWAADTVREVLLRPRNAGLMVYQGEEIGDAPWDAIVALDTFRAVQRILTNPDRKTGPGAAPKYLGTNLFKCGICTDEFFTKPVGVEVTLGGRAPRYKCKVKAHMTRNVEHTDKFVVGTVLARLALPDAQDLLVETKPGVDVKGLRVESATIRKNLNEMAVDLALGRSPLSKAQVHAATVAGQARVAEIESALNNAVVESPLKPLIGVDDIEAAWKALPLSHQRLVVDTLVTVRLLAAGQRGRGFDPASVEIKFKKVRPAEAALAASPRKGRTRKSAAMV